VVNAHGRFVWYELITTNVQAAKTFYTKVMGWSAWDASVPGRSYTFFTVGKSTVSGLLHMSDDVRKMGTEPGWIGYVAVDDVDAAADRVTRLGGTLHVPPRSFSDFSRFATFVDPQNARLALLQWLKPVPEPPAEAGATGRVGWQELIAADVDKAWAFYGELFGWQRVDADTGEADAYRLFSAAGQTIGGMLSMPETMPDPFWRYYFNSGDVDAAARRVKAGGGRILDGPSEVPGGNWVVQCADPQGAVFGLEGKRDPHAIGYFEQAAPGDPSAPRSRR